ncbi:hypothetical protein HPC49_12175 [Pyxidicoccus fallax]|uniref:Uncharacterized protein n=1 Tax=Pyxidicoccus fallax TaxID=394095 RepID=A0A848LJN1_9BACT|nr:DUF6714 family protein [Pyxidicoccus fallax]NMO17965.1 hypothetical protein [Pyxidicoccus fallax]NPC78996.1 hypothetical protein [Pyxidicoccus fallax]
MKTPPPGSAECLAEVRRAFPVALPPPALVAREGLWFDEAGLPHAYENPEALDAARHFAGRPWTDFAPAALLQWELTQGGLPFLAPRALAYYLPAYLVALLTEPLDVDTFGVLESVVGVLTRPDEREPRSTPGGRGEAQWRAMVQERLRSFQAFVDALDEQQRSAVTAFLKVMEPLFESVPPPNPARTALERYWTR